MSSVAGPSGSARPTNTGMELVIFNQRRDVVRAAYEPEDVVMAEPAPEYQVEVPTWLASLYRGMCEQLTRMEMLATQAFEKGAMHEEEFPLLYDQYKLLLTQQHHLYDLASRNMDELRSLQEEQYRQIMLASNNFATYVDGALVLMQNHAQQEFDGLRQTLNNQIQSTMNLGRFAEESRQEAATAHAVLRDELKLVDNKLRRSETSARETKSKLDQALRSVKHLREELKESKAETLETDRKWEKRFSEFTDRISERLKSEQDVDEVRGIAKATLADKVPDYPRKSISLADRILTPSRRFTSGITRDGKGKGKAVADPEDYASNRPPSVFGANIFGSTPSFSHPGNKDDWRKFRAEAQNKASAIPSPAPPAMDQSQPATVFPGGNYPDSDSDLDIAPFYESGDEVVEVRRPRPSRSMPPPPPPPAAAPIIIRERQMEKPPQFKGAPKENFRLWLQSVEMFFEYDEGFLSDQRKVAWIGGVLRDDALNWYQSRMRFFRDRKMTDTWADFISAMSEKFIDPFEDERNIERLYDLEYKGDMEKYLREMENLNVGPCLSGIIWRQALKKGLNEEVKNMMACIRGFTNDDAELIANLREAGRRVEERNRERKRDTQKSSGGGNKGPQKSQNSGGQSREQQRPKDSNSQPRPKGNRDNKSEPKGNAGADSGKKEKKHTDASIALKGISDATKDARRSRRACLRCGGDGHGWYNCQNDKKTLDPKTAAAGGSSSKRKAEEVEESETSSSKKPKVSGVAGRSFADRLSIAKGKGRFEELEDGQN